MSSFLWQTFYHVDFYMKHLLFQGYKSTVLGTIKIIFSLSEEMSAFLVNNIKQKSNFMMMIKNRQRFNLYAMVVGKQIFVNLFLTCPSSVITSCNVEGLSFQSRCQQSSYFSNILIELVRFGFKCFPAKGKTKNIG